ncbi:hypothetical protein NL676_025611 [Syzygium grande]|nr:hypothetical protein NL676_025611 [Syzygium grande]
MNSGFHRIIGSVLIMAGLYLVLWAKSTEAKFAKQKVAMQSTQDHGNNRTPCHITSLSVAQPLLAPTPDDV